MMGYKNIIIRLQDGESISGGVTVPEISNDKSRVGVVFAHGAGNDMNHPLIISVADKLAAAGYITLRFNFLYREKGKKSPDPEYRLIDAWKCAVDFLKRDETHNIKTIIAVGKSLGGRIASQATAAGTIKPDGLIFLGYPLHAPGRKDKLKDEHLHQIKKPMLFFEGTRDPFCDLEKFNGVFEALSCPKDLTLIKGGNHSFELPKADERPPEEIYNQVADKCKDWIEKVIL